MPATRPFRASAVLFTASVLLLAGCSTDAGTGASGAPSGTASDAGTGGSQTEVPEELRPYYEQELRWQECGMAGFQCATLTAPLDYDSVVPADDLQLAVARSRAVGQEERLGSLVVNPGGPGASAVEYLQGYAGRSFPEPIRARYDLVALDARGTGGSEPVECLPDPAMDAFTEVDRTPDDEEEADELFTALEEFGAACAERSGRLLEHVSTEESARDLDLLRAVLGDEELHYYGASYGTKLGATYAALHPDRTGRLVLDAGMDPSQEPLERDLDQAAGFETAFRSFLDDCTGDADCPVSGAEDVRRLFAELDAEPLTATGDRRLTESLATVGTAQALYDQGRWPQLREALRAALEDEDGSGLLELADEYHGRDAAGEYGTLVHAFPAISCLDGDPGIREPDDVREVLADFEEASPTFGADFAWATLTCAAWPVAATGTAAPTEATGTGPLLVLGTTRDPATPYHWSEALADQLDAGVLLTRDGDGHGALGRGACVDEAVGAYLLDGTVPPEDTVC